MGYGSGRRDGQRLRGKSAGAAAVTTGNDDAVARPTKQPLGAAPVASEAPTANAPPITIWWSNGHDEPTRHVAANAKPEQPVPDEPVRQSVQLAGPGRSDARSELL